MKGCDVAGITTSSTLHLAAKAHPDAKEASTALGALSVGLS